MTPSDPPLQAVFRDALSNPNYRERAGWLRDWMKRFTSSGLHLEADRIGLTYIGFGNTAARALGWHKVEKNNAFVPLGWELHPETLYRLRRAIDRCFEAFLSDTEASPDATRILQSFNRAELTKYTAIDALRTRTATPSIGYDVHGERVRFPPPALIP